MPRFAANLSLLFTEVEFLDRFERAAVSGFRAVEFLFPYDHAPAEIKARLDHFDLELALFNTPPGDAAAGERGLGCLPGREAEFRAALQRAVEYASVLRPRSLHVMAGRPAADADAALVRETFLASLRLAAPALGELGVRALVEPINAVDIPGYYVNRTAQALELIDAAGVPNLGLQYDIYHAQRSEGELAATIARCLPRIGHMQLADNPGRHEPGTGEIAYAFLFEHIDRLGYDGFIGCEYHPQGSTEAGLGWFADALRAPCRA